jgi:6-phosphogluconolactonase
VAVLPESSGSTAAPPRLVAVEDAEALAEEATALVLACIAGAIRERGNAHVVLAGGSTPRRTHAELARAILSEGLAVRTISWWFGDERWVNRSDPQSNEGMARETLLRSLGAAEEHVHSWDAGAGDPVDCARRYGEAFSRAVARRSADVVMLGMGADGHTASLFPGRQVPLTPTPPGGFAAAAVRGGNAPGWRLTLTPQVLCSARAVIFLVSGADKAGALRGAVNGGPSIPASWIRGGSTTYLATRDAAGSADTGFGPDIRHA